MRKKDMMLVITTIDTIQYNIVKARRLIKSITI
jgi:hypothetical protein